METTPPQATPVNVAYDKLSTEIRNRIATIRLKLTRHVNEQDGQNDWGFVAYLERLNEILKQAEDAL